MATIVRTNSSHTIGYYGLAQVSCGHKEALTGGGYYSSQWHESLSVYRNGLSEDGKKWMVEMIYYTPHHYGNTPVLYGICNMCKDFIMYLHACSSQPEIP